LKSTAAIEMTAPQTIGVIGLASKLIHLFPDAIRVPPGKAAGRRAQFQAEAPLVMNGSTQASD